MPSSILVDFKRLQAKKNTPPTAFCTSRSILGERRLLSKYFSSTQCISTRIRGIRTLKVREESYQLIHSVVTVQASSTVPLLEKPSWTQTPVSANVTAVLLVFILLTAALAWQRRQHLLGLGSQTSMCQSLWEDADHWRLKKRAKIRQAEHISSALRLLGEGNRRDTKAHSELVKGLAQNSICRVPLCDEVEDFCKEDLLDLYRLHVHEGGATLATLVQLQEMFGISAEEAEIFELAAMKEDERVFTI